MSKIIAPSVCAIVPVKVDSRRLPNKNFLMLGGKPLAHYIFETLLSLQQIDDVYAFCSDPRLISLLPSGVKWLPRDARLDSDTIGANELFHSAVEAVKSEIVLLAQIPGPFLRKETLNDAIQSIRSGAFDSATTVIRNQTYTWYQGSPLNYDPKEIKQTQLIQPVFTETSGLYAFKRDMFLSNNTRIFGRVKQIEVDQFEGLDIDEPSHFSMAEQLINMRKQPDSLSSEHVVFNKLQNLGNIRHLIFDLDGVLIDSLKVMESAWDYSMDKAGLEIEFSRYKQHIGLPFNVIMEKLEIPQEKVDQIRTNYAKISITEIDRISAYPGVIQGLKNLKNLGYKLSIFTSKDKERTDSIVSEFFPGIFNCIVSPENLSNNRGKPAPDGILLSCLTNLSSPSESIYVGDMKVDWLAACAANVTFIHASWGYGDEFSSSNIWFDQFSSLEQWLTSIYAESKGKL